MLPSSCPRRLNRWESGFSDTQRVSERSFCAPQLARGQNRRLHAPQGCMQPEGAYVWAVCWYALSMR